MGPCPAGIFPCDTILTLGTVSLQGRYQIHRRWLDVSAGLTLASSSWNAPTRGHYNTVGESTTDLAPSLHTGDRYEHGELAFSWTGSVMYVWRSTFYTASGGAPDDDVRAQAWLEGTAGPVTLALGASTYQRLGGIEVMSLLGTDDRWAVSDYDSSSAHAKLSLALGPQVGLHLSGSRVLWVRNGPPDAFDLALGVHRWLPPRK
jgi:hypothetical protein